MSKKMEGKQNTPSVIARLMGLDELPPQQPSPRQKKVLSADYLHKTASIGQLEKSSFHMRCLSRITAEKQHGTKHIFDSEIQKTDKQRAQSIPDVKPNLNMVRAHYSFARQKEAYAKKYHSIDKKLYHSEELSDALEDLLVIRDETSSFSTRIVVLKPNSRKAQKCATDLHLISSDIFCQSDDLEYREYGELLKSESKELNVKVRETENKISSMETSRHSFKDPRLVINKTGLEERKGIGCNHRGASRSRITVEDSSVYLSEASITSQGSFHRENREWISNPFPSGSFFASEAKKQIFERWKTTNRSEEVEVRDGRCTLAQMFSMHDGEARHKTMYSKLEKNSLSSPSCPQNENSELGSSLVISSMVGSTNEYIRNLPRPKLLKSSSIGAETPDSKTSSEASQNGWCSGQKEVLTGKHHKLNFYKGSSLESMDSRVSFEKQHYYNGTGLEGSQGLDYKLSSSNMLSSGSDDNLKLSSRESCPYTDKGYMDSREERSPLRVKQGVRDDLEKDMHMEADGHSSSDVRDNSTQQKESHDSPGGELIPRCMENDSELAMNLREINQPSPESVLEPPFKEDGLSAFEFFDSPILDLGGLAVKLQLLNPESEETNLEGSGMAVSSDEDIEKGSIDLFQDNKKLWGTLKPEESRHFSYIVNVLDEANLCGLNLDTWCQTCQGMESPISPLVFEALEKKYGKQTSWQKPERRLLFDRINSGLREILDSCMSSKPLRRRISSTLRRDDIEEELWMILLSQEKEVSKDLSEKVLGREMKWLELESDISIICREIEHLLFDELVEELCSNESL